MSEAKIDAGAFEEMEGRAAAATPGPWDRLRNSVVLMDDNGREIVTLGKHGTSDDLNFIASLRADVPNLIADLRAARAEVERLYGENQMLKAENFKAQTAIEFGVDDEVWRPGETAVDALIRKVAALEALEQSLRAEIARMRVGGGS